MRDETTEHLDLEQLADLLAEENSDDIAAHAAGCDQCRERLAGLELAMGPVGASLTALGQPEQPAELGARLHRAILREQAVRHPPAGAPAAPAALDQRRKAKGRGTLSRLGPLLAGAAALVVVGVVIAQSSDSPTAGDDTAPAGPVAASMVTNSGADYDKAGTTIKAQLGGLLAGTVDDRGAEAAGQPDPLARLRPTEALASCVAGLTDVNDTQPPLAVDYARFEGRPALAVVLPASNPAKVDVFFVGPSCTQADADLVHFARVDRPAG